MSSYKRQPHLSLGPQEVGHEGVATGRRDFSLAVPHTKAGFRIGPASSRRRARVALSAFLLSWVCFKVKCDFDIFTY